MRTAPCRGCGRPVVWATTDAGDRIPLDPSAPVYRIDARTGELVAVRARGEMVSHFSTCPDAARFSRGPARAAAAELPLLETE